MHIKIKRFNNIWIMGLILSGVILLTLYIIKLFCPSFVIKVAEDERICQIGHYIDNHKWAWYLATTIISFVSYYLICCACCEVKYLDLKGCLFCLATISILFFIKNLLPDYFIAVNYISLILLPFLLHAKFFNTTIIFTSLTILQILTVRVRGIIDKLSDVNYATLMILMIDYYIVELLFYFAFNTKIDNIKKEKIDYADKTKK